MGGELTGQQAHGQHDEEVVADSVCEQRANANQHKEAVAVQV